MSATQARQSAPYDEALFELAVRMGDNALILGQRVSAWCGHAPVLEEDIAMANMGLDLIGQAKLWLSLAGEIEGEDRSGDDLAFLRSGRQFRNCLLVERPNGDYAQTLMRQFLYAAWHLPMLRGLMSSAEPRIADIAEKSSKEVAYHLERSSDLVIRLGDGTEESHRRTQAALDALWPFAGELTSPDEMDAEAAARGLAPDLAGLAERYDSAVRDAMTKATLTVPEGLAVRKGGKAGLHTEDHDYILGELQFLQRAFPGAKW